MSRYDKYFNITVKREVYEELKKLAETHGLSVPDFLALVAKTYNLMEALNKIINVLGKSQYITGNIANSQNITPSTVPNTTQHATQSGAKSRRGAFDIFMERGYTFFSDLAKSRSVKDPGRVYESIKKNAVASKVRVVECDLESDRVLLRADVWDAFKRKLSAVKTPDDRAVLDALKEEWEKKLYTLLVRSGGVHFDYKSKEWIFDSKVVREVEESEEEYAEDWEVG